MRGGGCTRAVHSLMAGRGLHAAPTHARPDGGEGAARSADPCTARWRGGGCPQRRPVHGPMAGRGLHGSPAVGCGLRRPGGPRHGVGRGVDSGGGSTTRRRLPRPPGPVSRPDARQARRGGDAPRRRCAGLDLQDSVKGGGGEGRGSRGPSAGSPARSRAGCSEAAAAPAVPPAAALRRTRTRTRRPRPQGRAGRPCEAALRGGRGYSAVREDPGKADGRKVLILGCGCWLGAAAG